MKDTSGAYDILSTQKNITYNEKIVGEWIQINIAYFFADLPLIRNNFWNV